MSIEHNTSLFKELLEKKLKNKPCKSTLIYPRMTELMIKFLEEKHGYKFMIGDTNARID